MPQSIAIGLLALGGVLLLVAFTGGKFKIFGAEVDSAVSSASVRLLAGVLGVAFVVTALAQNKLGGTPSGQAPASNQPASPSASAPVPGASSQASAPASSSAPSAASSSALNSAPSPATESLPARQSTPADHPGPMTYSQPDSTSQTPLASNLEPKSVTSANEFGIVFDPPSNVRELPTTNSRFLCSVSTKTSIRILGSEGDWYQTDICGGKLGYIHRSQVKF